MSAEAYTKEYFEDSVGGSEFFRLYGGETVKPAMQLALLRASLAPGMTALDAGCGRGELLRQLEKRGVSGVGLEPAPPALAIARKTSKAPLVRAGAAALPFQTASFDRIFFLGVLDHLTDAELTQTFAEFARVLKPGGFVLANTCVNTDYYKRRTYALRRALAGALGLKAPTPLKSSEDEAVHVNEHCEKHLEAFFSGLGWKCDVEPRPNDKLAVFELYGPQPPAGLPLSPAGPLKRLGHALTFWGPFKRHLARELFCRLEKL